MNRAMPDEPAIVDRSRELPQPIGDRLAEIRSRLQRSIVARGLAQALIFTVGCGLAVMTADLIKPLHQWIRLLAWSLWLSGTGAIVFSRIVRPLFQSPRDWEIAALGELKCTKLGEDLTGSVSLITHLPHGSPALIAELAKKTSDEVKTHLDPAQVVPGEGPRRWLATGLCLLLALIAPALVAPDPFATLWKRFLAPWRRVDPVAKMHFSVVPGDTYIALGSDLEVAAVLKPRLGAPMPTSAQLEWTAKTGPLQQIEMTMGTKDADTNIPKSFNSLIPQAQGFFAYRVRSGREKSRWFRVLAVAPPTVQALTLKIQAPEYAHVPEVVIVDPREIKVLLGSRVTIEVTTGSRVDSASVVWPMVPGLRLPERSPVPYSLLNAPLVPQPLEPRDSSGRAWGATFAALASGPFGIVLSDTHRIANRDEPRRILHVIEDQPPAITLTNPDLDKSAQANDTLALEIEARDDLGIATVEIEVEIERGDPPGSAVAPTRLPIGLGGIGTPSAAGDALVQLDRFALHPGDRLRYRARTTDTMPTPEGPHVAYSRRRELAIVASSEPMFIRRSSEFRRSISRILEELKKANDQNRRETEQLRFAADAVRRENGVWDAGREQQLGEREEAARSVRDRLDLLAREVETNPTFAPLAVEARQVAAVEAESSRAVLAQARRRSDPLERLTDLQNADPRLVATGNRIDQLHQHFENLAKVDESRAQLELLARREEALAADARKLAGEPNAEPKPLDRAQLDHVQAGQEQVRRDLAQMLNRTPELRGGMLDELAKEAGELAKQTQALAERQRQEARKTAENDRIAPELHAIAQEQRALEADARRLGLEVDPTLAEHQRGGANADAIRAPIESLARGDANDARGRMEAAEHELRRLATDLEDIQTSPRLAFQRLARREDALVGQLNEALANIERDPKNGAARAELSRRIEPIVRRQEAIMRVADMIGVPQKAPAKAHDAHKKARNAAKAALEALHKVPLREADQRINEARSAFQQMAETLRDPRERRDQSGGPVSEFARNIADVARDSENLVRELHERFRREPTLNRVQAEAELANRFKPLAQRARDAANRGEKIEIDPSAESRRTRAIASARTLAKALDQNRRDQIPHAGAVARAVADRLDRAVHGHLPDDEHSAQLAQDIHELAQRASRGTEIPSSAQDQRRIAAALGGLNVPEARHLQDRAVASAGAAARTLETPSKKADANNQIAQALDQAHQAAQALAQRVNPPTTEPAGTDKPRQIADPDLRVGPRHSAAAQALTRRQERLIERLTGLAADRVEPQQDIRRRAAELGQAVAELGDRARPISPRSEGPAREAANLLEHQAPPAMDQSAANLAQGKLDSARDDQRHAADLVENAARRAEDLVNAINADRPPSPEEAINPNQPQGHPANSLGNARQDLDNAANQLAQAHSAGADAHQSTAHAADAMQQAAGNLHSAANPPRSHHQGPGQTANQNPTENPTENPTGKTDPSANHAGTTNPELARLQSLVKKETGRSWGELPGHLRTEILQMSRQDRYRADYQSLIRRYFRQIASSIETAKETE